MEFHLHKDVVAKLSKPLDRLVNDKLKEAIEGKVEWPGVDVDTFHRFCDYAYTGNFEEAEPRAIDPQGTEGRNIAAQLEKAKLLSQTPKLPPQSSSDPYSFSLLRYSEGFAKMEKARVGEKRKALSEWDHEDLTAHTSETKAMAIGCFQTCIPQEQRLGCPWLCDMGSDTKFCVHAHRTKHILATLGWSPRPNHSPFESYEPVFSSLLDLYVVADKYLVDSLMNLCLHRFHRTLFSFELHWPRGIFDLLTVARMTTPRLNGRRDISGLLLFYFLCISESLVDVQDFKAFLRECPQFARHLYYEESRLRQSM